MVSILGLAFVFIAVITWGMSSVGYKLALGTKGSSDRDPITSLAFRYLVVTAVLTPFIFIFTNMKGVFSLGSNVRGEYWLYAFLAGLFDILGHGAYFMALRHLDSSRVY